MRVLLDPTSLSKCFVQLENIRITLCECDGGIIELLPQDDVTDIENSFTYTAKLIEIREQVKEKKDLSPNPISFLSNSPKYNYQHFLGIIWPSPGFQNYSLVVLIAVTTFLRLQVLVSEGGAAR